ncbi:MAG: lipoprotein [Alphaproteobacteria bacterium]
MSVIAPILLERRSGRSRQTHDVGRRRRLLAVLGASLALAACGRKGPLELPPVEPVGDDEAGDTE